MMYVIEHSTLGWCWWDLPAFLVLLAVIVVFIVKVRKQNREEKDLEDQISSIYADNTQQAEALGNTKN